jgi:hypothetical protein
MKLYIYNNAGQQIAEFYNSEPEGEILWQGDSWDSFTVDTGYTASQIGGFFSSNGSLSFSNALLTNAVNPIARLLSPIDKLNVLTAQVAQLNETKQVALLSPSGMSGVYLALNAGNVEVAKGVIEDIPVGDDIELIALKNDAIALLES